MSTDAMHVRRSISAVIAHYGDPGPTASLVSSLARDPDIAEVIVVDDASIEPLPPVDGASVIRRERNGGFGAAINSGVRRASGELVLVLNSDLDIPRGLGRALLDAAGRWPGHVIAPAIRDAGGAPAHTARRFPTIAQHTVEWLTPLARFRDRPWWHRAVGHEAVPPGDQPIDWAVGAALLIPRDAFEQVGGFDERFYMNSEETDLQRRLSASGAGTVRIDSTAVTHAGGGSSDAQLRRRWLVESRATYAEKWGRPDRLRAALTAATVANLAVNGVRRARGSSVQPVRVLREELSLIWSRR